MIFVSVGTHRAPFDRLVQAVDEAVGDGRMPTDTVVQIGHGTYIPRACSWFRFCDRASFVDHLRQSDVIISHGGIGTLLPAVRLGKRVIAVPRRARYREHQDDHQLDICGELSRVGMIECVAEPTFIATTLAQPARGAPKRLARGTLVRDLRAVLHVMVGGQRDWLSTIEGPVELIAVLAGDKADRHPAAHLLAARFPTALLTVTGKRETFDEWARSRWVRCTRSTRNTYQDLLAVRSLAIRRGYTTVVLVTSGLHGRRVMENAARVFGSGIDAQIAVAPTGHPPTRWERWTEFMKRLYYRVRGRS